MRHNPKEILTKASHQMSPLCTFMPKMTRQTKKTGGISDSPPGSQREEHTIHLLPGTISFMFLEERTSVLDISIVCGQLICQICLTYRKEIVSIHQIQSGFSTSLRDQSTSWQTGQSQLQIIHQLFIMTKCTCLAAVMACRRTLISTPMTLLTINGQFSNQKQRTMTQKIYLRQETSTRVLFFKTLW